MSRLVPLTGSERSIDELESEECEDQSIKSFFLAG